LIHNLNANLVLKRMPLIADADHVYVMN
jgi:hypothetical protein